MIHLKTETIWSYFLLHCPCGFVRVLNPERSDTPCLPAQVCHPKCQSFFFFLLLQKHVRPASYLLSVTAQVRTSHSFWLILRVQHTRQWFSKQFVTTLAPWPRLEHTHAKAAGGKKTNSQGNSLFCFFFHQHTVTAELFCSALQNLHGGAICLYAHFMQRRILQGKMGD